MATTTSLEERIIALLRHLSIARAHFAACMPRDWEGLLTHKRDHVKSLTLICPMGINHHALGANPPPLLVVSGDRGRAALDAQRNMTNISSAQSLVLQDYFSPPWADPIADRRDEVGNALVQFLSRVDAATAEKSITLEEGAGEIAEINYSVRGKGSPLVLMPLALSPSQWEPLINQMSQRFCTITLSGAHLGMVSHLETRAQSSYMRVIDQLINELNLKPGQSILEAGCGPGAIVRRLAKRSRGGNRIVGADVNRYLLREAAALAQRDGLDRFIEFQEADAERLPFADEQFDNTISCTVMEEGDADRMLGEFVRVTKPGGKIGAVVRSNDLPRWVNLSLSAELKRKVESSGLLGGNVNDKGCADASLYRRMNRAGLVNMTMLPQWASHKDGERLEYLHDRILSLLSAEELSEWRAAVASAQADGTFFISEPFHCAVGTKW